MDGWIRIERKIFKHDFFAVEPMSEREAFVWLIARAAYKNTRHRVGSKMLDVPRGSFFATQREMQREWRWKSLKRVQNFLSRLDAEGMIKSNAKSGKSQITICNYADYQAGEVKQASNESQPEVTKERNKQNTDGGDAAYALETPALDLPPDATDRDTILNAMGLDHTGLTATGRMLGGMGDMAEAQRWGADLGLSLDEQCTVIRETMRRKRDGPPGSFKYFSPAMQRYAGQKTAPALTPTQVEGGHHGSAPRGSRRGNDAKSSFIRSFAEG